MPALINRLSLAEIRGVSLDRVLDLSKSSYGKAVKPCQPDPYSHGGAYEIAINAYSLGPMQSQTMAYNRRYGRAMVCYSMANLACLGRIGLDSRQKKCLAYFNEASLISG